MQSKKKGEVVTWLNGASEVENDQITAITEFYVDEVGFVAADPSADVRNVNPYWDERRLETLVVHFGWTELRFSAFSIDKSMYEIPIFGGRNDLNLVDTTLFCSSAKKLDSMWTVTELS